MSHQEEAPGSSGDSGKETGVDSSERLDIFVKELESAVQAGLLLRSRDLILHLCDLLDCQPQQLATHLQARGYYNHGRSGCQVGRAAPPGSNGDATADNSAADDIVDATAGTGAASQGGRPAHDSHGSVHNDVHDLHDLHLEAESVDAALRALHDHVGWRHVSGARGGPLQGWYRPCPLGKVHSLKYVAPVRGVHADQLLACVREFDLIQEWNKYCTAALVLHDHDHVPVAAAPAPPNVTAGAAGAAAASAVVPAAVSATDSGSSRGGSGIINTGSSSGGGTTSSSSGGGGSNSSGSAATQLWVYGAAWMPFPLPQPDSLMHLRGWDLFEEHGCYALTVRTVDESELPRPPAAPHAPAAAAAASSGGSSAGDVSGTVACGGGTGFAAGDVSGTVACGGGTGFAAGDVTGAASWAGAGADAGATSCAAGSAASARAAQAASAPAALPHSEQRSGRKHVTVRSATALFKPLAPALDGTPRTLGAVVAEIDPHMPSVPAWAVEFMAKVMAPFLLKALEDRMHRLFADVSSTFSSRHANRPLYRQVRQSAEAVLLAQAKEGRRYPLDALVPGVVAQPAAGEAGQQQEEEVEEAGGGGGWFSWAGIGRRPQLQ